MAIVGSRDFADLDAVPNFAKGLPRTYGIVSGSIRVVDTVAINTAKSLGMQTNVYLSDWNMCGRSAGFRRNFFIVANASIVYTFWNGTSKGTKHTIDLGGVYYDYC